MKKFILLFALSPFIMSGEYVLKQLPNSLRGENLLEIMYEDLKLKELLHVTLENGANGNDFLLNTDPKFFKKLKGKDINKYIVPGYYNYKNAKDIPNAIMIIDGPANARATPNGKILYSLPNGMPVRLLRIWQKWRLVQIPKSNIYVWTFMKNLKPLNGNIILHSNSRYLKNYPSVLIETFEKQSGASANAEYYKRLKKEGKCPKDLSESELDGFNIYVPSHGEGNTPGVIQSLRMEAYFNCPKFKAHPKPTPMRNPPQNMKVMTCNCFQIFMMEGAKTIKITKDRWADYSNTAHKNFKIICKKLKYHYSCSRSSICKGKECNHDPHFEDIICPKSCFK